MGEGRSTQVDGPHRALAKADNFPCSPHLLEDEMFPVHFPVRVPQLYLRISVLLSMLCSPMGLSPVLPQSIFLNPLLLRWQYRFNFSSSSPLWFSAPLGLFTGNCPYFLLSSDMLWIGCLWEVIQHSLVDLPWYVLSHFSNLFPEIDLLQFSISTLLNFGHHILKRNQRSLFVFRSAAKHMYVLTYNFFTICYTQVCLISAYEFYQFLLFLPFFL